MLIFANNPAKRLTFPLPSGSNLVKTSSSRWSSITMSNLPNGTQQAHERQISTFRRCDDYSVYLAGMRLKGAEMPCSIRRRCIEALCCLRKRGLTAGPQEGMFAAAETESSSALYSIQLPSKMPPKLYIQSRYE